MLIEVIYLRCWRRVHWFGLEIADLTFFPPDEKARRDQGEKEHAGQSPDNSLGGC